MIYEGKHNYELKKEKNSTRPFDTTNRHDFFLEYCQGSHIKTSVFKSVIAAYCSSAKTTPRCISSLNVTEFALVIQTHALLC